VNITNSAKHLIGYLLPYSNTWNDIAKPLSPNSDQYLTSPYNITVWSNKQVNEGNDHQRQTVPIHVCAIKKRQIIRASENGYHYF